jgi:enoyl-CoA hydratase
MAALAADASDWAAKELKAVSIRCPTSAKVALRLFAEGLQRDDFAAEMAQEYRIAARMIMRHDFTDGVRAVLVDKDHSARWKPHSAADVTQYLLDDIFAPLPAEEEWAPLVPAN